MKKGNRQVLKSMKGISRSGRVKADFVAMSAFSLPLILRGLESQPKYNVIKIS